LDKNQLGERRAQTNAVMAQKLKKHLASKILYKEIHGKDEEKRALEAVLERLCIKTEKIIDSERPDFFVNLKSGKYFCCEVTQYFGDTKKRKGSRQKTLLRNWIQFTKNLLKKLKAKKLNHFYGAIHFKSSTLESFQKINKTNLIDEIVKVLEANKNYKKGFLKDFEKNTFPILHSTVEQIYICNIRPEKNALWWHASLQSGTVVDAFEPIINIVKNKNELIEKYDCKNAIETWLVIYAEATVVSNTLFVSDWEKLHKTIKQSKNKFDRIIIWDKFSEKIHEVFPSHKIILEYPNLYIKRIPAFLQSYLT